MRVISRVVGIGMVLFLLLFPIKTEAAGEFTTELESRYTLLPDNATRVRQTFRLINNFSTMFATQYALEVASTTVSNVRAESNGITLDAKLTPTTNKTTISFAFPDKVVGKDQVRTFVVEYTTTDIMTKTGNVLEVNIPKLANPTEFANYTVLVDVEQRYGTPALTQPPQYTAATEPGRTVAIFRNVGQETGISVLYGTEQIAKLDLQYHLENPKTAKGIMQIALPSDGTYQRVYYSAIDPLPHKITQDQDGNWLAHYELEANQRLRVQVEGYAVITLAPHSAAQLLGTRPGKEYLAAQPYWPVTDPSIQTLAKELQTPKAIYDYVVKTLRYDYARLENNQRVGAAAALKNPTSAVCLEFTDLFITLARAAGIPAREVNGFAFTQNDRLRPLSLVRDVLHAWPEYWDDQTGRWIAIDPTWGNTTGGVDYFSRLDFNHIAFVTRGISSEYPYPVGVYKYAGQESKDVNVTFVAERPMEVTNYEASVRVHPKAVLGMADTYSVILRNTSLHALYDVPYTITRSQGAETVRLASGILTLPPLSETEVPVQLGSTNLFASQDTKLITTIADRQFTNDVSVQSTISRNLPFLLLVVFVGGCTAVITFISWRLLVPR